MTPLQPKLTRKTRSFPAWRVLLLAAVLVFSMKGFVTSSYGHRAYREGHAHQLAPAIRDCRIALRLDSGSALNHNNLGYYLYESGQFAEAEHECREALRIRPNYASAHDSLGQVLSHTGRFDEAIQECHEAIRLKPDKAVFYNSLGFALYQRGQKAEARQQWQRASAMGDSEAASDARHLLAQYPE